MQLYFIRHAQSTNNAMYAESVEAGKRVMDPELTALGERQAEHLAQFLRHGAPRAGVENAPAAAMARPSDEALGSEDWSNRTGFRITHLYASLMVRAVRTGTIVAAALDLPLRAWVGLHEAGGIYLNDEGGAPVGYPGNNRAYFTHHYPQLELPETLGEAGWWNRPYETESERAERAAAVLAELLERHGSTADRVAIISHAGFYNSFLRVVFGLPPRHAPDGRRAWFMLHNTAITRIDFGVETTDLVYANRFDFLPPEDVT